MSDFDANKAYTIVTQMFPTRHARYRAFTNAVPHSKNPDALRYVILQDWEAAAKLIDEYIAASGGADAHRANAFDKTVRSPIVDEHDDTSEKLIYKVYIKPTEVYEPLLRYIANLPHGKVRQKFQRLALVMGFEKEGTMERIRPSLSIRK